LHLSGYGSELIPVDERTFGEAAESQAMCQRTLKTSKTSLLSNQSRQSIEMELRNAAHQPTHAGVPFNGRFPRPAPERS
jgi:hypothetical protein